MLLKLKFGLAGPTSQFLIGKHEFSELVLSRMVPLMDESHSVLPVGQSAGIRRVVAGKMYVRTSVDWSDQFLFGQPERMNGKRPNKSLIVLRDQVTSNRFGRSLQTVYFAYLLDFLKVVGFLFLPDRARLVASQYPLTNFTIPCSRNMFTT